MFFPMMDPVLIVISVVGGLLSMWAAMRVRSAFATYSQVSSRSGYTAAQAAHIMLDQAGIHDVEIVPTRGQLTDHYDPTHKRLALSEGVYDSTSVAALGIACHEAGHAIQHAERYPALAITSALWKPAAIGSSLGIYAIIFGIILNITALAFVGVLLFGSTLLFQLVTLPVEFDASRRAKQKIIEAGIIGVDEREGVDRVLNAAAMTYVAAAVTVAMQFLYYIFLFLGNSREE